MKVKCTITLTETPSGNVSMSVEFDPPVTKANEDSPVVFAAVKMLETAMPHRTDDEGDDE